MWAALVPSSVALAGLLAFEPYWAVAAAVATAIGGLASWDNLRRVFLLAGLLVVPVLSGLAIHGAIHGPALRNLDDAVLACGLVLLLSAARSLPPQARRYGAMGTGVLIGGALVALAAEPHPVSVSLVGAIQDLRFLGVLGIGIALAERMRIGDPPVTAMAALLAWNVANLTVASAQLAAGQYSGTRFGLPFLTGLFGHPTESSVLGAMLLLYVAADRWGPRLHSRQAHVWASGLAVANIVLSTRTKPLLALSVGLLVVLAANCRMPKALIAAFAACVPITALGLFATIEPASQSGGARADVLSHAGPRVALLAGARSLAGEHFPLGVGLGRFGAGLDQSLEDRVFVEAGLGGTFGFRANADSFRSDNDVAHLLAERGVLGLALWMLGMFALLRAALELTPKTTFPAAALAAGIALSPLAPALHSGPDAMIVLLPASLCLAAALSGQPSRSRARHTAWP